MAGNSWDVVGGWLTGNLELLRVASRPASWTVNDSSITATFETADLTAIIGTDVVAAIIHGYFWHTSGGGDRAILTLREVGDTLTSTDNQTRAAWLYAGLGASYLLQDANLIVPARGTDPGKFEYAEYSSSYNIDSFAFQTRGRVRP